MTDSTEERRFAEYDLAHPETWQWFVAFAREKIAEGYSHFSADAVLHRVRWETAASDWTDEYKCNNNYSAYYARKFHAHYPEHDGFFRLRRSRADAVRWAA